MRVLLDSTVLMEGERRRFDLGAWARQHRHEILICDAGVTEYLAGRPVKDAGKEVRFGWGGRFRELEPTGLG